MQLLIQEGQDTENTRLSSCEHRTCNIPAQPRNRRQMKQASSPTEGHHKIITNKDVLSAEYRGRNGKLTRAPS